MSKDNHHWVPRLLIKNFTDNDGRVFRLDIQTDEVTKPPPKYAASAPGFNYFEISGHTVSYEDRLEKIETAAAPVLRRIANAQSCEGLTDTQRRNVANFIAAQSFRTEAFYKGMGLGIARKDFGPIFEQLWQSAFVLATEIKERAWTPMVIEHDDVFYLGDNPVVLQHTETPGSTEPLGFDIEGVEAFIPLSPKCALYMPCRSISRRVISDFEDSVATLERARSAREAGVVSIPEEFLSSAMQTIEASRGLYEALTKGVAVPAVPANVENLNYLQCAWAHTAIYSNRRAFAFARHVFENTPAYRESVKVTLAQPSWR